MQRNFGYLTIKSDWHYKDSEEHMYYFFLRYDHPQRWIQVTKRSIWEAKDKCELRLLVEMWSTVRLSGQEFQEVY